MLTDLETSRYEDLQNEYNMLDTVVLSVGGPIDMANPYFEEFSTLAANKEQDISRSHGDILGNLLFDNHQLYSLSDDYATSSISLQILEHIPNVICIASGQEKVRAIISAAQQKYIKVLITDEDTARRILSNFQY